MKAINIKAENKELFEAIELFARLRQILTRARIDSGSLAEGRELVKQRIVTNLDYLDDADSID